MYQFCFHAATEFCSDDELANAQNLEMNLKWNNFGKSSHRS